jgi:selenocysteine-specific elongation factor
VTHLVLGVIGHVDHGKTALVRVLTGKDTDRLAEEKERGISIALGFAHLGIGKDTEIDLIDMPGHERFVRTMISGATGIDAVLLVVAANEGIKPQTLEHVDIASLLSLQRAVIAITKIDLVSPEQARQVADEAVQLLSSAGMNPLPPILTSSLQETGIEELRQALEALAANQRPRAADGLAFLPVDRAFSIAGHGPVVTGTLRGAPIDIKDTLELLPLARAVRVRGIQVHGASVTTALPGQRVALNLRDVDIAELQRGMTLAAPETIGLSQWLTIATRSVESAPALKNGMRLRALLGTAEVDVRLRLLDRDVLEAGQNAFAQLHFAEPLASPANEHVILRIASPAQTVAGGKVLETEVRRRRRNHPETLQRLADLRTLSPEAMIAAEVYRTGSAGTTTRHLSRLFSLGVSRIVELLAKLPVVVTRSGSVMRKADVERAKQLSLARSGEDQARSRDEIELAAQIAETLRSAGLAPPNPGAIVTDAQSKRAVDRLLREGIIMRAVDRAKGREILFHRDAIDAARRQLAPLLERAPGLLVTEIGAALGISRKYSMPLVDHLDTIGFTRRIEDRRMLSAKAGASVHIRGQSKPSNEVARG